MHIIDAQSPARVEFVDRYADPGRGCESIPFSSAFRPQETLTLHVFEAMIRRMRAIGVSPVTGAQFQVAVSTGDNVDNEQLNEIRWFIDILDGANTVSVNSGEGAYEGVQSPDWGDVEYWHPDPAVADKYKQQWGFPDYSNLLEDAMKPFGTTGIGLPWLQTFGNHDGLMQGNAPRNPVFEAVAVGGEKISGLPPGVNPCDSFQTLRDNPFGFPRSSGTPGGTGRDASDRDAAGIHRRDV